MLTGYDTMEYGTPDMYGLLNHGKFDIVKKLLLFFSSAHGFSTSPAGPCYYYY